MSLLILCLSVLCLSGAVEGLELDQPPRANQKPYTPADGATVNRNPPPFIWVPPADGLSYVLEIARAADFSRDVRRFDGIDVSTFALRETLPSGRWYWRYGVVRDGGEVLYSKCRTFHVPEGARKFPYPDIDKVIASVPKERPHHFIRPEELDEYRRRAQEGGLAEKCARLCARCDNHIGEELVSEPPYVKGSGPERGKNYSEIFRATRPPMDVMELCGLAYLLTGDEKYGREAKRRILHFFRWDPEGSTAYHNNDEPAMWVMMRGVRAYDWTYGLFSPEERDEVEACMRIRAAQFYHHLRNRRRFHTNPYESHAGRTLGFLGEACLEFAHDWPEAREWLDYVLTLFWNVYPAWGKDDGGWHEGPGYWSAYMSFALHFVVPLRNATGVDLMQKPFFQNTPYYLLYTNPPYAKISPFGDGESGGASTGKAMVMYAFSSLLQDPYIRWYAEARRSDGGHGVLGIVLHDEALEGKAPTELPHGRYFPGVGLVSLHTALGNAAEDIHFLIHSDPYGAISHAHADQNAFTLEAFREPLAIASGYYPWYGSDHHRKWSWESKSSNTITFDGGTGQVIRSSKSHGTITAFDLNRDYDYVAADATPAYGSRLTQCVRKIVHIRPGVFVIFDDVAAPEPVMFEWRLHARSEMALDEAGARVTVREGDSRMAVTFAAPGNVVMNQTTGFEYPPERGTYPDQWHLVVSPPEKTDAAQYLSVLIPYREGDEKLFTVKRRECDGGVAVEVVGDARRDLVAFRTGASMVKFAGEETDAEVVALRMKPGGAVETR
ncbi:MAG: DUF4962 domain-containing protein, partial [Candidatus Hydrogenedentota bacterium]